MENPQIIIYQHKDRNVIEVQLREDTVWLSQRQMGELFDRDPDSIGLHIKNIFNEGELQEEATTEDSSVVQQEAGKQVRRKLRQYNLDMIIAVGYRIKSTRATDFRIWANKVLREYLQKGYVLDNKKLREQAAKFEELEKTIQLVRQVALNGALSASETTGLLKVLTDYTYGLDLLDKYDHQQLTLEGTADYGMFVATYKDAIQAIKELKKVFGGNTLFGNEKDDSFKSSIATIYQSFDGCEFYSTIEEKAANLLYFIVKNHSFSDGNKRIAAYLFIWFLDKNRILYTASGTKRIADNALVALTLMIAESQPVEKDMMVKVVVNLINARN